MPPGLLPRGSVWKSLVQFLPPVALQNPITMTTTTIPAAAAMVAAQWRNEKDHDGGEGGCCGDHDDHQDDYDVCCHSPPASPLPLLLFIVVVEGRPLPPRITVHLVLEGVNSCRGASRGPGKMEVHEGVRCMELCLGSRSSFF